MVRPVHYTKTYTKPSTTIQNGSKMQMACSKRSKGRSSPSDMQGCVATRVAEHAARHATIALQCICILEPGLSRESQEQLRSTSPWSLLRCDIPRGLADLARRLVRETRTFAIAPKNLTRILVIISPSDVQHLQ